jgi:hypothetical protein
MVAASRLVALACASATATAMKFDMATMMKIKAFESRFNQDQINKDQKVALMEKYGFNDMQLFMSKQITANDFKISMKQNMKDQLIQNILNGGGLDLQNPFVRKTVFGDQDNIEMFSRTTPEPLQSIMRMIRIDNVAGRNVAGLVGGPDAAQKLKIREYGKQLLKKYQFKQFNTEGSVFTENFDEILLAEGSARKDVIKEILEQSMFEGIADPIDRSLMYYIAKSRKETDLTKKNQIKDQIKSLQTIKIFQGSVPQSSPVTDDNLFAFYQMVNGKVDASQVLNIALGDQLGPVSEQDFERYFGAPAKQFSCRAHTDVLRVPCGIKLKADECVAAGCCWDTTKKPECFHDLYGKIGSGILRRSWVDGNAEMTKQISDLFVGKKIPTLDKILRQDLPYGLQTYNADGTAGGINAVDYRTTNQKNWWDAAQLPDSFQPGPNDNPAVAGDQSYPSRSNVAMWKDGNQFDKGMSATGQRPRYGNPNAPKWKAHGPTQSPFFGSMPGINPTANPLMNGLGTLDEYYRIWIEFAESQDAAQCALIPEASRVKCMENFDALIDKEVNGKDSNGLPIPQNTQCYKAGCCFNEDTFLESGGAACYRATDYGTCTNLPTDFIKEECGREGITESECLTNVNCCYKPSADRKDPWCYKKFSATLREEEWCSTWSDKEYYNVPRQECFATKKQIGFFDATQNPASNVNNLVGQAQCEAAGCCFDSSLDVDVIEWFVEGLGYVDKGLYRCFMKKNPMIARTSFMNSAGQKGNSNTHVDTGLNVVDDATKGKKIDPNKYTQGYRKTCDASKWGLGLKFKRSCGENLSYYQCVYVNKCCYKPTVANEPACYRPEVSDAITGAGSAYDKASKDVYTGN